MEKCIMVLTGKKASIALVVSLAAQLYAGAALATPPANVVGTWTARVNHADEEITITNQGIPGTCKLIIGTIGAPGAAVTAPISGFYCPPTGRIHFLHKNIATGATVRVFTGNLSDRDEDLPDEMAGTFTIVNTAFGPFGERNFSASR
jgi:hypothetical protein